MTKTIEGTAFDRPIQSREELETLPFGNYLIEGETRIADMYDVITLDVIKNAPQVMVGLVLDADWDLIDVPLAQCEPGSYKRADRKWMLFLWTLDRRVYSRQEIEA